MTSENCGVPNCLKEAEVWVVRASARLTAERWSFCPEHGQAFWADHWAIPDLNEGGSSVEQDSAAFDIDMLFYDGRTNHGSAFSLREVDGGRRLECRTGPFEAATLNWILERAETARPLTHRTMATVIESLGGRLEFVLIDKFFPTQDRMFEAKLIIRKIDDSVFVDVRPSDAVALALTCEVPILVTKEVLSGITS